MDNQDFLEKWINGTLTVDERILFERTKEYQALKRISDATASFRAPEYDVPGEFARLQTKMASPRRVKVVEMPWLRPLMRVAAVLVIIAGVYFIFLSDSTTTIKTFSAEKTKLYLPDSSEVALNAFSELKFSPNRWTSERRVSLVGEAYFRVAKGSRFDVETSEGTVTVQGTQFNVKIRKDFFEVVCYEGLVEVRSIGKLTQLTPMKMFRVVKGVLFVQENTSMTTSSWLNDESSFESVPFAEVLEEFERQYSVAITTRNIDLEKLFTGRFSHSDFQKALQSISIPLNLKYEVSADKKIVVLSGETN